MKNLTRFFCLVVFQFVAWGQPTPPGTSSLTVDRTTGVITAPVSAALFKSANGIAAGGTVTSASVTTANGVSATVATATTTPAFTFTLGAITPSSVAATGAITAGAASSIATATNDAGLLITNAATGNTLLRLSRDGGTDVGAFALFSGGTPMLLLRASGHSDIPNVRTGASTTSLASLNLPHGTAPTPPVNGDVWTTATGLFVRVNGSTVGPLGTGSGGGISDGDYGDITASSGATVLTIDPGVVTLAKMANLAQDQFIVRTTASTGVPQTATVTSAARTVLDDTSVGAMVDTLGGASSTGTGGLARATSPTFVTPILGTPTSVTLTNGTGLPIGTGVSGLGSNVATFLATPSSLNLASAVTGESGTGGLVFADTPTLVTPILGVATATSLSTTRQDHSSMGSTETFDRANGDVHEGVLDANLTVTLSGWPASGKYGTMLIGFLQDGTGGRTVTWPAAVVTAPTVSPTASDRTWVSLWTTDGGTTVYALSTAETVSVSDVAYDATTWNGETTVAPSKNAVRDKISSLEATVDAKAPLPTVNGQTGTTYTLVIGDANKVVTMTNGSANTLTIPTNASVAFATGTIVIVGQLGAGATSIDPDTGVTLNGDTATIALSGQRTWTSLLKTGTNAWETYGGDFVIANAAITGATKTKITYDAKGLVTAGADAAQADITGITTADNPQFAGVNVGHASDTTLTRSSAGVLAVEGVNVITTSGVGQKDVWLIPIGDETTAITTGTKVTFRAPFAATVTAVRASLTTDSSSGTPTFDIHETGTTILSTKLTIDATEKTSTTAAAAAVISDSAIADDAELTIDVDVAGTGAAGGKVAIYVTRL
jgi:hypothetical protein